MKTSRFLKIVAPALILFFLAGCRSAPVYNVSESPLNTYGDTKPTLAQVEKTIVRAATSLGWSVTRIDDGELLAVLNLREHRAVADIHFNTSTFSITYKDSQNLNYDGTSIHKNYNGWIQRLENSIRSQTGSL
jgi:uncharacterized lipoprotein YajG